MQPTRPRKRFSYVGFVAALIAIVVAIEYVGLSGVLADPAGP